jgi:hypothetical protein
MDTKNEEKWKAVLGQEGKYEVSNKGNVRSLDRIIIDSKGRKTRRAGKLLKNILMADGYYGVSLGRNGRKKVHRLVLESFIGPSDLHCDHLNSNKIDNRIENLEYVTIAENNIRAWKKRPMKYMLGVSKHKDKFVSFKRINGKRKYLGIFEKEKEAHEAYLNWEQYA